MSTHECFAANTLNFPKHRLARYELQDSLAVWPATGQVVPPSEGAPGELQVWISKMEIHLAPDTAYLT